MVVPAAAFKAEADDACAEAIWPTAGAAETGYASASVVSATPGTTEASDAIAVVISPTTGKAETSNTSAEQATRVRWSYPQQLQEQQRQATRVQRSHLKQPEQHRHAMRVHH